LIQLTNISKSYSTHELFSNLNFRLDSGQRMGLVGRNGAGKSTLFKLILGEEHSDDGAVSIPKGYKIGSLKQHLEFSENTLIDEVALALSEDDKYSIYKVEMFLFGLGFNANDLDKSPLSFSGGYQIRINLAKLLITEPNLLLLDEPTNYLDILSLRWLKSFLCSFDGEVILITHDRDFMDSVCTHIMGLNRKQLSVTKGDTHKFYAQLASNDELYEKQKISQDKKVKELENFIAKNKARASTAALAQSKVKQLEKMTKMNTLVQDANLNFKFNFKDTTAKILLEVKDLSFGYSKDNILFKNISFALKKGEVLGIIGKNGKGKSTLLNVIAQQLQPINGSVEYHSSASFGHFGQTNISHLNPKNSVMDEIYNANIKLGEGVVRGICASMMFTKDSAKKNISLLSGGEKSRVMLGKIIAQSVNILYLDEPTNHLDMQSIDALRVAIKKFDGSCIVVTHSEALLRAVCSSLVVFSKDSAEYFNGGYDEFLDKIGWEEESDIPKEIKQKPVVKEDKYEIKRKNKKIKAKLIQERSSLVSPIKKEIKELEEKIIMIEEKLKIDQEALIKASNISDNTTVIDISKDISIKEKEIESSFHKLEISQAKLDEITKEYDKKIKNI